MLDNLSLLVQAPFLNVQLLMDGLLVGSIFALAAYGLALVWGVMNVKNLAQGDFVMMGGYVAVTAQQSGIHPILSLPIAIVLMFCFGWIVYHTIISRVIHRDMFTSLLATFGLALFLTQVMNLIWGPDVQVAESGMEVGSYFDDNVTISNIKLVAFGLAGLLAGSVVLFMRNSRMGQAIRATAQDPRAAKVMGIDTEKVYAFTFSLNAAICGAAGVLISMIWVIQPFYGITHSIRAFVIVTAAGLGNLPGVIAMGLGLGAAEQFSGFIFGAELQQATVVGLLVMVLIWRQIEMSRTRQVVQ
jgi:branched-chain amino acid transport system permease protein